MKQFTSLFKLVLIGLFTSIFCETNGLSQEVITTLRGPRLGVTILSGEIIDQIKKEFNMSLSPVISQFGWQFEKRFFSIEDGPSGVVEIVPLIGGVEQGKFLPSISGLIGMRSSKGIEFGVGPNLSLSGAAIVFAAGITIQRGKLNWPINFAITPSPNGTKFSLLFGFNASLNN